MFNLVFRLTLTMLIHFLFISLVHWNEGIMQLGLPSTHWGTQGWYKNSLFQKLDGSVNFVSVVERFIHILYRFIHSFIHFCIGLLLIHSFLYWLFNYSFTFYIGCSTIHSFLNRLLDNSFIHSCFYFISLANLLKEPIPCNWTNRREVCTERK